MKAQARRRWGRSAGNAVGVAVLLLFTLFPAYWMISTAFDKYPTRRGAKLLPVEFTTENFAAVFNKGGFGHYLMNSALVAIVTVLLSSLLALLAAVAVARFRFRFRTAVLIMILIVQMVPMEALVIPLFIQAKSLHLLNSLLGLAIVYLAFSLPFAVWMLRGFVAAVPKEVEEAAFMDGATWFQMFFHILVPLVMPGVVATSIFSFITAWNEFIFALTFLQDDALFTVAIGLRKFFGEYSSDWGPIMAASTLITLPVVAFFLLVQRNLVSGLAAGAVKG